MASLLKNNAFIEKSRLKGLLFYLLGLHGPAKFSYSAKCGIIPIQKIKLAGCDNAILV